MNIPFLAAEAILLAATLSLDAFVASFAYGSSGIKIPPASVVALNLVCSGTLGISLWMGPWCALFFPHGAAALFASVCCLLWGW